MDSKKVVVLDEFGQIASVESAVDSKGKWIISAVSALVFLIVASPWMYKLVDGILSSITGVVYASASGCPTIAGLVLHTIVFGLIVRALMEVKIA